MDKNKIQVQQSERVLREGVRIDLRKFLYIDVDKEKLKDELESIEDYNNIFG